MVDPIPMDWDDWLELRQETVREGDTPCIDPDKPTHHYIDSLRASRRTKVIIDGLGYYHCPSYSGLLPTATTNCERAESIGYEKCPECFNN